MKQARDYRKYNVRLTRADWQRGSCRVINHTLLYFSHITPSVVNAFTTHSVVGGVLLSVNKMIIYLVGRRATSIVKNTNISSGLNKEITDFWRPFLARPHIRYGIFALINYIIALPQP